MRLTLKETQERERKVREWIDQGLTVNDMAQTLGIRPEAVRKFLKVREWETHGMAKHRENIENE